MSYEQAVPVLGRAQDIADQAYQAALKANAADQAGCLTAWLQARGVATVSHTPLVADPTRAMITLHVPQALLDAPEVLVDYRGLEPALNALALLAVLNATVTSVPDEPGAYGFRLGLTAGPLLCGIRPMALFFNRRDPDCGDAPGLTLRLAAHAPLAERLQAGVASQPRQASLFA